MKFGVCLPNFVLATQDSGLVSKEGIVGVAKRAEELGYDSVWVTDHVVGPVDYTRLDPTVYDPLSVLSYVAAVTNRVSLGTSALVVPYRNPVIVAKTLATIDQLSGGRLILGAAAGWMRQEFHALGVPREERGRRTDEYLRVIEALWEQEEPSFSGQFFHLAGIHYEPKPLQQPRPPIWVGGRGRRAIRRAVELGDAWFPYTIDLSREEVGWLKESREHLLELARQSTRREPPALALRTPAHLAPRALGESRPYLSGNREQLREDVAYLEGIGVTYLVLDNFEDRRAAYMANLEGLADTFGLTG